jgi:phage-related protein
VEESGYTVDFYITKQGKCPIDEFLDSLEKKVRAKTMKWIQQLESEGPNLIRPYADILVDDIRELRVQFRSKQYRFLYFFYSKRVVMTHAFLKKTDEVPSVEVERAKRYRKDWIERCAHGG